MIVFDILGTMVDETSGIRRGFRALLPDIDDARPSELVELWDRHVDEQQREVLTPFAVIRSLPRSGHRPKPRHSGPFLVKNRPGVGY